MTQEPIDADIPHSPVPSPRTAFDVARSAVLTADFASKLILDGKPMVVGFVVKEDMNGRRFYDHELTEIENLEGLQPAPGATAHGGRQSGTHQGLVMNIVRHHLSVNPKVEQEPEDKDDGPRP